ncbi:NUDIX hydrolase [Streptosporangium subroseum]|uniref:NUDIX hydrolase n=1 Tax=Streptosporangium subroseum TaxID=106412 RepID=UPI003088B3EE|nr:NUDIX domain-containing protein [Streptosporangium subroseum]
MPTPTLRHAARVITLDERDRLLLLRYEENGGFWATPGGSLEPGEDHHSAALREVREELGVSDVTLGPELAVRSKDHLVGGQPVRQVERYYAARVHADDVDPEHATQPDDIRAWRWWTLAELATSDQTVYPIGLGDLIAGYLRDGAPAKPLELTD